MHLTYHSRPVQIALSPPSLVPRVPSFAAQVLFSGCQPHLAHVPTLPDEPARSNKKLSKAEIGGNAILVSHLSPYLRVSDTI